MWRCSNEEILESAGTPSRIHVIQGRSLFLGNCQYSQLLGKGVAGLERLGKYLRKIYINQLKFIPSKFIRNIIEFRTTHSLRTFYSQMSLIRGLYPEANNITINTADKNFDHWRQPNTLCPIISEKMRMLREKDTFYVNTLSSPIQEKLSKAYGSPWLQTNDASTSAKCQGFPNPQNISDSDILEGSRLKARQTQYIYSHEKVYPLLFGYCAGDIVNSMINRLNGGSVRFVHWSAHDSTLLGLLGFLNYTIEDWPPYGSYSQIELHRSRSTSQYYVVIRFNGEVLSCPRFNYQSKIPFSDFLNFTKSSIPTREECGFDIDVFNGDNSFYS